MKIKINFFPLVVVSWIMIFYLIGTDNLSWYFWPFIAFIAAERLMVQAGIWLQAQVIKAMYQQQMKVHQMMQERAQQNEGFTGEPPM